MEKLKFWERVGGILATIAICLAVWRIGGAFNLSKSDWASWVQAVGSILAIVGAFYIGKHQADVQMKVAEQARQHVLSDRYSTIKGIVDRAFQKCLNVEPDVIRNGKDGPFGNLAFTFSYREEEFSRAIRLLEEAPFYELGSDVLVAGIFELRDAMESVQRWVQMYIDNRFQPRGEVEPDDDMLRTILVKDIGRARTAYQKILTVTGGEPRMAPEPFWG
jgi:hypothetical protein